MQTRSDAEDGARLSPDGPAARAFRRDFGGTVHAPGEEGYEEARSVWNGMIDRTPGLVARCSEPGHVREAVDFVREEGHLLSVRGGGHNIAGSAVCEGGLMLDLSPMADVRVDPAARRARVGPGATLADFDREAQAHGLATPLGINSTTGVAGLTLGGGFGWLTRKHGLTVDNLTGCDVVTADGRQVRASAAENPDLFWGLRGGGGNFGVVTSFEFDLHPVGPEVLSGLIFHPVAEARSVLDGYRDAISEAPDELACWVVLRKAPPLPFLPAGLHGTGMLILALFHAGDPDEAGDDVAPLREIGTPVADVVQPHRYVEFQSLFDPLLEPGARNYWKSHNFTGLSDGLLDTVVASAERLPSPHTEIFIGQLGGAAGRVPVEETAYPHRDADFVMNVHGRWTRPGDDSRCISWTRGVHGATAPFATGGVYSNFVSEGEGIASSAYGPNYPRLVEVKDRWDPGNLFRMNQNVIPSAG